MRFDLESDLKKYLKEKLFYYNLSIIIDDCGNINARHFFSFLNFLSETASYHTPDKMFSIIQSKINKHEEFSSFILKMKQNECNDYYNKGINIYSVDSNYRIAYFGELFFRDNNENPRFISNVTPYIKKSIKHKFFNLRKTKIADIIDE